MNKAYRDFFKESPAGAEFIIKLHAMINAEHESGENNPDLSRDHMQRAKGIRLVISEINRLCVQKKQKEAIGS